MAASKKISLFDTIIGLCACLSLILIVIGVICIDINYNNNFHNKIEITKINEINNLTSYTFDLKDSLFCEPKIKKTDICNDYIKCPENIIEKNIYDYYCDCSTYQCSFENKYNIYSSAQFYIIVSGFTFGIIICFIFIIGYMIKKCPKNEPIKNELVCNV